MRYTNKFIQFLNGSNTVAISNQAEFTALKCLMNRVSLDCCCNSYEELVRKARINKCLIEDKTILVEYQPGKGMSFGYKSYEESEKWYEDKPWTYAEMVNSMSERGR